MSAAATCQNLVTSGSASASRIRSTSPLPASRNAVDAPPANGSTKSSGLPSDPDDTVIRSAIVAARPDFAPG